ncbi:MULTISPECIES: hypothetical protein [unclassified Streptomyces]|uniref:hypothetical protein n=1 Tax=unclassified Streptomyces TaxID=2593676 RepID=UPI0036FFA6E2
MTDTFRTPPTAGLHHERPFPRDRGRWEKERSRALRTRHIRDRTCSDACEPVLIYERTPWGWFAWTIPGDCRLPETPHQIGVLTPAATRGQRLALRWLTRRPAQRLALASVPGTLRLSATAVALISLAVGLSAIAQGVPFDVAQPAMSLAPILGEYLPARLDARAREHVRIVEDDDAVRYLRRLADLQAYLVQASAGRDRYELRRSAEIGHNLLWDAADLLQTPGTHSASSRLSDRERLMLQLASQVTQLLKRTAREHGTADARPRREPVRPPVLHPPDVRLTRPQHTCPTGPPKGTALMSSTDPTPSVRTTNVYLLFAHEPYYPGPGSQEINTTVIAAGSLLHPQVLQPDGARIHDLLTQGRQPGEIIPLSTLTHELNGGADWPTVGDWEQVTTDLVRLVRSGHCDALSLGLSEIARALVCSGPHSHVRAYDAAANEFIAYGPTERATVLTDIDKILTSLVSEHNLWPGNGLVHPPFPHA